MSTSLDDIWDDPIVALPAREHVNASSDKDIMDVDSDRGSPTRPSPAKRRRTKLFFSSDSDSDSPPTPSQNKTKPIPIPHSEPPPLKRTDVDALFGDLDDLDDLPPVLDVEQLRREAEGNLPPPTPHALLQSSSPPRDFGDGDGDGRADEGQGQGKGRKGKDGSGGLHERRPKAKLDEARLLGPDGLPALVKQARCFKPRGKGHELSDLNRLIQIYQFWSHKMYPNKYFDANVQRIEQLCHTKRMISALGVWSDEFHGTVNGLRPEEPHSDGGDSGSESDKEEEEAAKKPVALEHDAAATSSSPPRAVSPVSKSAPADDDDWDIDTVIREVEERERASADSTAVATTVPSATVSSAAADTAASPTSKATVIPLAADDEDEAMWDEFGIDDAALLAATQAPQSQPAPQTVVPMTADDDEDMWDVVREMEEKQQPRAPASAESEIPGASGGATVAGTTEGSGTQPALATNDEGWDEMYL